jgi:hypothetical protein
MKGPLIFLFALLSFSLSCSSSADRVTSPNVTAPKDVPPAAEVAKTQKFGIQMEKVSLNDVDKEGSTAEAADRKIIRNADITIEVPSTVDAQHQVTSIAESNGGFVVTSEAKQRESNDPAQRTLDIKLVVRVPSIHFGRAFDEI